MRPSKIGSKLMEKLKHARSLNQDALSLEEALDAALDEYIQKHDPLEKAKRAEMRVQQKNKGDWADKRGILSKHPQNTGYPVLHESVQAAESRPPKRRPIPASIKHHVTNTLENLSLLCSAHHRHLHGQTPAAFV